MSCKDKNFVAITATIILIASFFLALCSSIGITYFVLSGINTGCLKKKSVVIFDNFSNSGRAQIVDTTEKIVDKTESTVAVVKEFGHYFCFAS